MKKLIYFFIILFCINSFAKITTCSFIDFTVQNQPILPNTNNFPRNTGNNVIGNNAFYEGYIIIAGLNIASDSGQRLMGIYIEHWGYEGYPFILFDSAVITNRNGTILGVLESTTGDISGFISIPGGARIPANDSDANSGSDFFIGVRTRDDNVDGAISNIRIPAYSVFVSPSDPGDTLNSSEVRLKDLVCELLVGDLMPIEYQPQHPDTDPERNLKYPSYIQYQPGEMIRPRFDTNTYDYSPYPFKRYVPQIIPYGVEIAIIGIACAQRNVVLHGTAIPWSDGANAAVEEKLTAITLTFTDIGENDFDPSLSFYDPINKKPTITLWKDIDGNGIWNPNVDIKIDNIDFSPFRKITDREWEIDILPKSGGYIERIETTREDPIFSGKSTYDYFIVINLYPNPENASYRPKIGQDYKIWIKPGGIIFGPISYPSRYAGIDIAEIKTLYNNLHLEDISQRRVDGIKSGDPVDRTYNIIPVIGINIAGGPNYQTAKIRTIKIEILSFENFDPRKDLAPLSNNEYSGITLYRDNKQSGNIGSFDIEDIFIPTVFDSWRFEGFVNDPSYGPCYKYSTMMTISLENLPPYDWSNEYQKGSLTNLFDPSHRGSDFFICIRTTENISYNSRFRVRIPKNGVILSSPLEGRYNTVPITTQEIKGNIYTEIIPLIESSAELGPNSDPVPLFKIILNDNNSGKKPQIEGLSIEFYDRGGFTLDDLASFEFIKPVLEPSGWYRVTYLNKDELKKCGVVIFKSNITGFIDWENPVLIKRYRILSLAGTPSGYQFEFNEPISIPTTLFVAIRTSNTFTKGDSFDAGIVGWGLSERDWETWGLRAIGVIDQTGLKTNVYVRKSLSGIFNPQITGTIILSISSTYDYIKLNWINQTGKKLSFDHYEVIRSDGQIFILNLPFDATEWKDERENPNGPKEGIQYQYTLRMFYWQGSQLKYIDSNTVPDPSDPYFSHKGKILGFPDVKAPGDVNAIGSGDRITLTWVDNSFSLNNINDPYRATQFLIRQNNLTDNTYFETTLVVTDLYQTFYTYVDLGVQPNKRYKYEVYAQRITPNGIVESKPGVSNVVTLIPYTPEPGDVPMPGEEGGGGGCFIATAAFGTSISKYVQILREFRDSYLLKSYLGRKFVKWYYKHSPKVASLILKNVALRLLVRILLLPIIFICYLVIKGLIFYFIFFITLLILSKKFI